MTALTYFHPCLRIHKVDEIVVVDVRVQDHVVANHVVVGILKRTLSAWAVVLEVEAAFVDGDGVRMVSDRTASGSIGGSVQHRVRPVAECFCRIAG